MKKRREMKSVVATREALQPNPRQLRLLTQVARYYVKRFAQEPRARTYLAERGLTDAHALEVFGAGYCDGTLNDVLPYDEQVHADLKALGVIKDNGKELLRECVVFPLWNASGACVGLYGRRLFNSEVKHLYLPGPRRGLVNGPAAKRAAEDDGELVLCESVLDAVSLYVAGLVNVIPCYGTGGFTQDHAALLTRARPKRLALCFDGDDSGRAAALKLQHQLKESLELADVRVIELPKDEDPNSLLVQHGAAALRKALESAAAPPFHAAPAAPSAKTPPTSDAGKRAAAFAKTPQGFTLHLEGRLYEVKASVRQGTQLRVTLKATRAAEPTRFELSTIDLYSHRSREWFASLCAALFAIEVSRAAQDLSELVTHLERTLGEPASNEKPRIELTDHDREEALALLRRPTLMHEVLEAFEQLGYADEVVNKQLGYLVATSRKLERPLSLLIESRSSAGKSALQDAILCFVPEEECLKYSRITDQALFYSAEDALEHKLLVIEEAAGMGGAVYSIRALQSGEELRIATTTKDPTTGRMRTEEHAVKARTSVMMTTTDPNFDEETKSRFIRATVNESAEHTRRILEVQRLAETLEGIALKKRGQRVKRVHQNAQRLLKSVTVANPYAPQLTFPSLSLQARRDNTKYLGLIKTVALLHQHQRETHRKTLYGETVEYIEVALSDIAIVNRLAKEALAGASGDVTPQARQLLALIRKMLMNGGGHEKDEVGAFSRRRLREFTAWSDWQVRTHLGELVELEYLHVRAGAFGKEYAYELADTQLLETLPGFGLTDTAALAAALSMSNPANPKPASDRGAARHLEAMVPHLEAKSAILRDLATP